MNSKIPVIHLIGQAHLDPVWLWPWTEGRAEALATCYSAANCLERYPDFHFTRGEAQIYRWVEEEAPELWGEICRFIAEGRWHVVNGMVIQPDMNLPQGESLVRQALLGKRYFQEKFGLDVRTAFCVDSFGHAATLPQILHKCGFDSYIFMRPKPHEKELPAEDGLGYVVRLADKHGRGGSGRFIWQGQALAVSLSPFEVATWRIFEANGRWCFAPCDMLEREQNA